MDSTLKLNYGPPCILDNVDLVPCSNPTDDYEQPCDASNPTTEKTFYQKLDNEMIFFPCDIKYDTDQTAVGNNHMIDI